MLKVGVRNTVTGDTIRGMERQKEQGKSLTVKRRDGKYHRNPNSKPTDIRGKHWERIAGDGWS